MKMLVATDGSPSALNAVRQAIKLFKELAPSGRHSITLLTVRGDTGPVRTKEGNSNSSAGGDNDAALRALYDKELKPATRLLDRASVKYQVEIRTGPSAAREILACAKAGKFDQIVLGAKGLSAIADLLLGSVAHRVLATAEVPVLLVK